jgi:hypothetical protein
MIPAILLRGVEPVAALKAAGSGRSGTPGLLSQFDSGDIVSARVEARLPDGNFKVMVAGQAVSLNLPSYLAPGDSLELELISGAPQLTFALRKATQQVDGPMPSLSNAGRLLAALMLPPGELPKPVSTTAAGPLLAAPAADQAQVSRELAQTLSASGLFYESHQAEWVAGQRSLAQILQEPQAGLTWSGSRGEQTIPAQAVPLVQQQLVALDTATVLLQVEIWPRQWMQWAVEERQTPDGNEAAEQADWTTRLRLQLPQLGELNAALSFAADGLRIRLDAASAGSAALLQQHRASLQDALAAAELPSAGILITHHGQT